MILTIKPTLKQHQAHQAIETPGVESVFFGGGAGGGKSWFICESRLLNAVRFPGYRSFIGRNELKRLMQSTFITWNKVCKFYGVSSDEWRFDGKYNFIEFTNGSHIDLVDLAFRPTEDPLYERLGSLEYSDGAIEEAGEVHPLAYDVLKARVNRHLNRELGINPCTLLTGNPKKNWTYQIFYKPWKEGRLPPELRFIQSLYKDNPHTAETYEKTLAGIKDKITRERLMNGNWEYEDDPAALMNFEAISDLFTNTVEEDEEKYLTADIARYGGDKIVIYLWRGWEIYRIIVREKQGIDETSELIRGILKEEMIPYSHAIVDEDGIGGGVVDQIRGIRGFIANTSPYEVDEDEIEESEDEDFIVNEGKPLKPNYANLKTQCAYYAAHKVNKHLAAVRTQKQEIKTWLTEDLEQVKEERVDTDAKRKLVPKEEVKIVLGRSPDFGDAFIMRSVFDLKKSKVAAKSESSTAGWVSKRWRK